jgi:hypothetical protein
LELGFSVLAPRSLNVEALLGDLYRLPHLLQVAMSLGKLPGELLDLLKESLLGHL